MTFCSQPCVLYLLLLLRASYAGLKQLVQNSICAPLLRRVGTALVEQPDHVLTAGAELRLQLLREHKWARQQRKQMFEPKWIQIVRRCRAKPDPKSDEHQKRTNTTASARRWQKTNVAGRPTEQNLTESLTNGDLTESLTNLAYLLSVPRNT